MNRELFQKIDKVFTEHPEWHDQSSWESRCGTTRCVAGWAIHLTTGKPLYTAPDGATRHPSVSAMARRLGLPARVSLSDLGAELLGLDDRERYALFHYADNDEAREVVAAGAAGDRERFTAVVDRAWDRVNEW